MPGRPGARVGQAPARPRVDQVAVPLGLPLLAGRCVAAQQLDLGAGRGPAARHGQAPGHRRGLGEPELQPARGVGIGGPDLGLAPVARVDLDPGAVGGAAAPVVHALAGQLGPDRAGRRHGPQERRRARHAGAVGRVHGDRVVPPGLRRAGDDAAGADRQARRQSAGGEPQGLRGGRVPGLDPHRGDLLAPGAVPGARAGDGDLVVGGLERARAVGGAPSGRAVESGPGRAQVGAAARAVAARGDVVQTAGVQVRELGRVGAGRGRSGQGVGGGDDRGGRGLCRRTPAIRGCCRRCRRRRPRCPGSRWRPRRCRCAGSSRCRSARTAWLPGRAAGAGGSGRGVPDGFAPAARRAAAADQRGAADRRHVPGGGRVAHAVPGVAGRGEGHARVLEVGVVVRGVAGLLGAVVAVGHELRAERDRRVHRRCRGR